MNEFLNIPAADDLIKSGLYKIDHKTNTTLEPDRTIYYDLDIIPKRLIDKNQLKTSLKKENMKFEAIIRTRNSYANNPSWIVFASNKNGVYRFRYNDASDLHYKQGPSKDLYTAISNAECFGYFECKTVKNVKELKSKIEDIDFDNKDITYPKFESKKTKKRFTESERSITWLGISDPTGAYRNIIASMKGQITDGIGEGSDRESAIFRYYYADCAYVHAEYEDNEIGLTCSPDFLPEISRCIWRIAQIERNDNNTTNKNIIYKYLNDATWKQICILQGAIKKIIDFYQKHEQSDIEAMREAGQFIPGDKRSKEKVRIVQAKNEAAMKAKEEKFQNDFNSIIPEAKDKMRAEDAWFKAKNDKINKGFVPENRMLFYLNLQLKKITDKEKAKRRCVAFYNELLKHDDNSKNFEEVLNKIKTLISFFIKEGDNK